MKLSLRTLLLIVALVSVITAALAQPSLFWMRLMFTVAAAFLALAIVGALAAAAKSRAFWIGAAVFSGAYAFVLLDERSVGAQNQAPIMQRALITQSLLDALAKARGLDVRSHSDGFRLWDVFIYRAKASGTGSMGSPAGAPPLPPAFDLASYNHFLITGHCAFVILVGLIGGLASRWMFCREEAEPGSQ
jgi:hypothetical protein